MKSIIIAAILMIIPGLAIGQTLAEVIDEVNRATSAAQLQEIADRYNITGDVSCLESASKAANVAGNIPTFGAKALGKVLGVCGFFFGDVSHASELFNSREKRFIAENIANRLGELTAPPPPSESNAGQPGVTPPSQVPK